MSAARSSTEFPRVRQAVKPAEMRVSRTRPQILLAEDDTEMNCLLAHFLRQDGYDVLQTNNGSQLLEYVDCLQNFVANEQFFNVDLVISDIRMPGLTGLNVLAELRKDDCTVPVILITAFGDAPTHAEAHRLGAVAVFDKPFDVDEFRMFVRQLLPPTPRWTEDAAL
jgi:DNA-binding response OmpR family regulator